MVDSINIPTNLTKVVDVVVKYNDEQLRRFLTDLLLTVQQLEQRVKVLEDASRN